jgi:hypothetical protein
LTIFATRYECSARECPCADSLIEGTSMKRSGATVMIG